MIEYMIIASQILSVVASVVSRLQKTKAKALVFLFVSNILSATTCLLLNQDAGLWLTVAAILRSVVFFLYDHFKVKPSVYVLITIETQFLIIAGLTWQSSIDIFILLSVMIFTFTTWQNNMYIVRVGMVLDPIILIVYNLLIGAHISIVGDVLGLISTIVAIVYYDFMKRSTPISKRLLFYVRPKAKRKKLKTRLTKNKTPN